MTHTLSGLLSGAIALSVGLLGTPSTAEACRCPAPELSRDYASAKEVFSGRVLWTLEFGLYKFSLVSPGTYYKGCPQSYGWTWLSTQVGESLCEASFEYGTEYLFFTEQKSLMRWSASTTSCSGNRVFDSLSEREQQFLNTREVCCGDECTCGDGSAPLICPENPCLRAYPCETSGLAKCEPNRCGEVCDAEFFAADGRLLCQEPEETPCTQDKDCDESQYCGFSGVCTDIGSCSVNAECNLPGNTFDYDVRCTGFGVCNKSNTCEFQCGNSACMDHAGYDFGDCDMVVGWVMSDGECVNVTSGCSSLHPNGVSPFANRLQCEVACKTGRPASKCGVGRYCEIGKSFCREVIPGVRPEEGEPSSTFECVPLPERCVDEPSCDRCFDQNEPDAMSCSQEKDGAIFTSVALP